MSIRFYNNREVRAIWSDNDSRWFYSATDIVRAINNESDYVKAGILALVEEKTCSTRNSTRE